MERKEAGRMRKAAIGLAAILAGCVTAGALEGVESQNGQQGTHNIVLEPGVVAVELGTAPPIYEPLAPIYSEDMPLPSETFSYDTAYRAESEEIVTMDPHGYTIIAGKVTFIHTEVWPEHDRFYNPVLEGGCENLLKFALETSSQRWIDYGCEGIVDVYEEYDASGEQLARESPASPGSASLYGSHYNLLLADEIDVIWRARWNISVRREVIHWWDYSMW